MNRLLFIIMLAAAVILSGCVSAELGYLEFEDKNLDLGVIAAPDAEIDAYYSVTLDANNPVGTILSIGTSAAKAVQVEAARKKLDAAMKTTDVPEILETELSDYFENKMDMKITSSKKADFTLVLDVRQYGIDAGGSGSSIRFIVDGKATLYTEPGSDRVWRESIHTSNAVSPSFFGLPSSAGNVLTAAMLAELTEEEIALGLDRVARAAAREVGSELERDIYRSRQRR